MPAPKASLAVSGSNPVTSSRANLEAMVDGVAQALFDQIGAVSTGLSPAGNWSAAGGTFPSGAALGTYYVVSTAGTVNGQAFAIGDWLVPLKASPSTTTYVGNWFRADYSKVVPRKYKTVTELLASLEVARGAGAIWEAQGFQYEEVTTGQHVTTAGGVKLKVLPGAKGLEIEAFGAVASATQSTASSNVTAIRAAFTAGAALGESVHIPKRSAPYLVDDSFLLDATFNGLHVHGRGTLKFANALVPVATNNIAAWMIRIWDRVSEIKNLRIEGIKLDGNRAAVKQGGATPVTSFGIWLDEKTLLGEGVEINHVEASHFLTSGYQIQQGPITVRDPIAHGNGQHGIGTMRDPGGMLFRDWAHIINPLTNDNEGYGIDFAGGKVVCSNSVARRNWYGNSKVASGLERLILRGAVWTDSPGNPADAGSGFGFQTTRGSIDFTNTSLDIDGVHVEGNAAAGFQIGEFEGPVRLGKITARNNSPATVGVEHGDIALGCAHLVAGHLESTNSNANGILLTNKITDYRIGYAASTAASRAGLTLRATTGTVDGCIRSGRMLGNNRANLAGAAGAAVQHLNGGSVSFESIEFHDGQGTPTQVSGIYVAGGTQCWVDGCDFGTGISATGQVRTATAGTRVEFGRNKGLVTRQRGRLSMNGGTSNHVFTLPTPLTSLASATYVSRAVPASADARGSFYLSAGATFVQLLYTAATPAGTNNVTIEYDTEMVIQL